MTTISPFDDLQNVAPVPQKKANDSLGQQDFLKLMVTQFQNQDPFEPMDNGEFLGQLAQFSTVNGISSLNTAFEGLAGSMQDNQALQAATLVGKDVQAVTDIGYLQEDGKMGGAVELDSSTYNLQIEINGANGELIRTIGLGEQPAGIVEFEWDGLDAERQPVKEGFYQVTARAQRGNDIETLPTVINAEIESVTLGQFGEGMTLNLAGGQSMPLGQIYRIIG